MYQELHATTHHIHLVRFEPRLPAACSPLCCTTPAFPLVVCSQIPQINFPGFGESNGLVFILKTSISKPYIFLGEMTWSSTDHRLMVKTLGGVSNMKTYVNNLPSHLLLHVGCTSILIHTRELTPSSIYSQELLPNQQHYWKFALHSVPTCWSCKVLSLIAVVLQ